MQRSTPLDVAWRLGGVVFRVVSGTILFLPRGVFNITITMAKGIKQVILHPIKTVTGKSDSPEALGVIKEVNMDDNQRRSLASNGKLQRTQSIEVGECEKDAKMVARVCELEATEREIVEQQGEIKHKHVTAQKQQVPVGKIKEETKRVATVNEVAVTEQEIRELHGKSENVPTHPEEVALQTGAIEAHDTSVARIVDKETTERHVEPMAAAPVHSSDKHSSSLLTGTVHANMHKLANVVETSTTNRKIVDYDGPVTEIPIPDPETITPVRTGVIRKTQRIVGYIVEEEVVERDIETVEDDSTELPVIPDEEIIETGIIDEASAPVARVVENYTKERDIELTDESDVSEVECSPSTEYVPTGRTAQQCSQVAEVINKHSTNIRIST